MSQLPDRPAHAGPHEASASSAPDVLHIWLPSQRSLCELAVRRVVSSAEEADAANLASRSLPACEACILVTQMLSQSASQIADGRESAPGREDALLLLAHTTWPWVANHLIKPTEEGSK